MKWYTVERYDDFGTYHDSFIAESAEDAILQCKEQDKQQGFECYGYKVI